MLKQFIYTCILISVVSFAKAQEHANVSLHDLKTRLQESKKDTSAVNALLQLSEYFFVESSKNMTYSDSALLYGNAALKLGNTLHYSLGLGNSYEQISKVFHIKNDTAKGKYFANKAIAVFKANNFFLELGYAYYDLSGYYSIYNTAELATRIYIVEQLSLPAFEQSGSKLKEADILKELGDLLQLNGEYVKALYVLNRSLQLYKSLNYSNLQGIYNLTGYVYSLSGNNEQALRYGLLAVNNGELMRDSTTQMVTIYNRIASSYQRMKKYYEAYNYFEKGLTAAKKFNDTGSTILLSSRIARTLISLNKPNEALAVLKDANQQYTFNNDVYLQLYITTSFLITYDALKNYKAAQKYCDSLLVLSTKIDANDPDQTETMYPVTEFYMATHQYDLARKRIVLTDSFYTAMHTTLDLAKNELLWFKLDSIQSNYQSSITHYQKYKALEDSSLNEITSRHIEQLQIEFETEKKDKDIKLLENDSKLQQEELTQSHQTRNWITGVALLLLMTSALMIYNARVKQRTNKQLKTQQVQIENKNRTLQHLVKEKDWLVKEIHHRVKNNFHIVIGLLGTQASYLKTEEAINAMNESKNRIFAMSLIHQKLYQSENLTAINMVDYIHELVNHLRDSFNIRQSIQFKLKIDKVELDLSHCIPLGLILNEAITNAIKYAFEKTVEGVISISFQRISNNRFSLKISDNGIGLPENFNTLNQTSMGMKLMYGLTDDIDGALSITNDSGTKIILEFNYEPDMNVDSNKTKTEQTSSI